MAVSLSIISAALFHNCSVSSTEPRLTYCGFFKVLHRIKMIPCLALKTLSDHVWQFFAFLADTAHWTNCFRGLKSVIILKFFSVLQLQDQQYIYLNSVFWSCVAVHLSIMKFIWHIFVSSLHFAGCFKSSSAPVWHLKTWKSMNLEISLQTPFPRSLMKVLNRNGTSTDFWESPLVTLFLSEVTLRLTFLVPNI